MPRDEKLSGDPLIFPKKFFTTIGHKLLLFLRDFMNGELELKLVGNFLICFYMIYRL